MMKDIKHMDNAIEEIAKEILDISSLETTNSGEDFHERAVWVLKEALEDAWLCGYNTAHPGQQELSYNISMTIIEWREMVDAGLIVLDKDGNEIKEQ